MVWKFKVENGSTQGKYKDLKILLNKSTYYVESLIVSIILAQEIALFQWPCLL